jgi:hypothetical protein
MYVGRTPREVRRWTAAREPLRREFGLKLIQTWLALAFGLCATRVDRAGKARGLVSKFRVIPHAL